MDKMTIPVVIKIMDTEELKTITITITILDTKPLPKKISTTLTNILNNG